MTGEKIRREGLNNNNHPTPEELNGSLTVSRTQKINRELGTLRRFAPDDRVNLRMVHPVTYRTRIIFLMSEKLPEPGEAPSCDGVTRRL